MKLRALAGLALVLVGCVAPPASTGDPNLDAGREVFRRVCAACHGAEGGGGTGPALGGVAATFPECGEHQKWVTLGSERWRDEVGSTYGAAAKEISGVMPSWETTLSADEIAQVAAFERFEFGGEERSAVLTDCGLPG